MNIKWLALICAALLATGASAASAAQSVQCCIVRSIDAEKTKTITLVKSDGNEIVADASASPDFLSDPQVGDQVSVTFDKTKKDKLVELTVTGRPVSWPYRAAVLAAAFVLLILLATLVTRGRPREFLIGADRRYSNSKVQLAFWFLSVMAAYLATVYLRVTVGGGAFLGSVDIPNHLLAVSGLSALTYGGAKAITTQKIDTIVSKGAVSPKTAALAPNILSDLFQNDLGEADLGDFQMILVTLIAIAIFLMAVINSLAYVVLKNPVSLPDIDTTLLSALGVGQGAYLVKKMASNPGEG